MVNILLEVREVMVNIILGFKPCQGDQERDGGSPTGRQDDQEKEVMVGFSTVSQVYQDD